ncbi:MAG: glycogen debranching enzyme GlgX, partial [Bacteroidales bacterium]|nr:glycogen debranching enzyme GlgX [Bacteroidales bacterium]
AGDEFGRTQKGNNNAYCQDNEISWVDWENKDEELLEFTSKLIHFRLDHPVFCRNKWFQHKAIKGKGITDIEWFLPEGITMSDEHWGETLAKSLGIFLSGDELMSRTDRGEKITDDTFYIMINSNDTPVVFTLPEKNWGKQWRKIVDTSDGYIDPDGSEVIFMASENIEVKDRSVMLLMHEPEIKS